MILVSEQNSFHVSHHALFRPFHAQTFVPKCRRRYFTITLFIKGIIPIVRLRVVYALFGSLASLEIIPLVAPGILSTYFFIHYYYALTINLHHHHHHQTEVSSFPKSLHLHFILSSHSNLFF